MAVSTARERLVKAVLNLAEERSISDVTAADICREAGVARDTFYRLAASPESLLASVLRADLDRVLPADDAAGRTALTTTSRTLIEHVKRFQSVYEQSVQPHLSTEIRAVLSERIQTALEAHLGALPDILPTIGGRTPNAAEASMLVSYAVAGAVGAIETWLVRRPDTVGDPVDVIEAASAPWWYHTS